MYAWMRRAEVRAVRILWTYVHAYTSKCSQIFSRTKGVCGGACYMGVWLVREEEIRDLSGARFD